MTDKEEEKEEQDENEKKDEDDDVGKEPRMISQRGMMNTFADNVDTVVNHQPIVLPEQGQDMQKNSL